MRLDEWFLTAGERGNPATTIDTSATENRRLDEDIAAAGGECLLDMRVHPGGSHHMKLVVLRHPSRPGDDVAFIGGIDLCHSRRDDAGQPRNQPWKRWALTART